jgi:hypothetical protein
VCAQGEGGRCFSRAEPRHKQAIVRLLKDMGEVAAMTGAFPPIIVPPRITQTAPLHKCLQWSRMHLP